MMTGRVIARWHGGFLGILFFFISSESLASATDSLQLRLYHGLDEMGTGTAFSLSLQRASLRTDWTGNANTLLRRPPGSFGELKSSGVFKALVARTLHDNLEVRSVFDTDFYRLERFEGPAPLPPWTVSPPASWEQGYLTPSALLPPQQINRSMLGLGATFQPDTLLELTTIIGQQWEKREGFDDQGLSASLEAELSGFEYKGYRNDLDVFLEQEQLDDRTNRELRFSYGMDKRFSESSSDRLEISYRQKRLDYHVWGTSAIGTRTDTDQSLRNRLHYDMAKNFGFILDTELVGSTRQDRTQTSTTLREEVNTANALTLQGRRENFSGWTRMKFDWGAQEDVTGLKRERGTSLEGGLAWFPTTKDSLAFLSAVRKRQYDTSDTANYDDRDRLRYEFDLVYQRRFSPVFRAALRAETAMEHLVYIFAQKSDQNHWNRIFKLRPEVFFMPHPDWQNMARFELIANSTDYDFDLDPANIKSTIYRRYTAGDSLGWQIARGWSLSLKYSIDLEDGGRFLWDEWVQQISEEYRTQRASLIFIRETHTGIRFDAGFSVYERKGWEHTIDPEVGSVKSPFLYLSRWGPLIHLTYPSASGIYIEANSDMSWVHEWQQDDYAIINLDLRVTWR